MESRAFGTEKAKLIQEKRSSLRDILNVVFRQKSIIFWFFVVVVFLVTAGTFLMAEVYQSEAKLIIKVGRESVSVEPTVMGPAMPVNITRESEINSEVAILTSRILTEKVVDAISPGWLLGRPDELHSDDQLKEGLRDVRRTLREGERAGMSLLERFDILTPMTPREKAILRFQKKLDVGVELKSNIVRLTFDATSPELAQDALQTLVNYYRDYRISVYSGQASPVFFEEQSDELLQRLRAKEKELEAFKDKYQIASMFEQKQAMINQINALQDSIDKAIEQASASRAKIASLEGFLKDRSKEIRTESVSGKSNYAADTYKRRLIDLRLHEADLAGRYQDDNRELQDVRRQIGLTLQALKSEANTLTEVTTGLDENYQRSELALSEERATYVAMLAVKEALDEEIRKRRASLQELSRHEVELAALVRDQEILEKEYTENRDALRRASFSTDLDTEKISNVNVVQPPTFPTSPIKPKKLLNIGLSLLLGLFGGLGAAFFVDWLDDSLKTNEEVERRLGLPVLTAISQEEFDRCI